MNADALRAPPAPLKHRYREDADAFITLTARGALDGALAC